jgi:hypothetical protein
MRLRIQELIERANHAHPGAEPIHIRDVAAALGLARTTLANVATFTGQRATNTRVVEALIRYFSARIPDFDFRDLFDFQPTVGREDGLTADALYPNRAGRR